MSTLWEQLAQEREQRRAAGLHRVLSARPAGPDPLLDLAGNDYLGLSRHPRVLAAATTALQEHGAGATGSRLVTGTTVVHSALERALAQRVGAPAALVFSSGYLANLAAVTALARPGTLVVSDAANHASLIDAVRLSRAELVVVPHARPDAVQRAVVTHRGPSLVVTDAVFSVDGSLAPLPELLEVVQRSGGLLLVDEAHAVGVLGPRGGGACAAVGIADAPELVRTLTLSKALGSAGGAVAGPQALVDHLVDTARPFVFDTGLAPVSAAAALAALQLVDDGLVARLRRVTDRLADALGVGRQAGPVVRVGVGDAQRAWDAQLTCADQGLRVGCFRPPSVPDGAACLRLTANVLLSDEEIDWAARLVREVLR